MKKLPVASKNVAAGSFKAALETKKEDVVRRWLQVGGKNSLTGN